MHRNATCQTRAMLAIPMVALILSVGCSGRSITINPDGVDRGLVIVLPGIDGISGVSRGICDGLQRARIGYAVRHIEWTLPLGPLFNQSAYPRNRRAARSVAEQILQYQDRHPGRPVFLVGISGGTAIAAWAVEALPPDRPVDGIVMLASSLSPRYCLTRALGRTRLGIVSFHSSRDTVLLGLGTRVFGTMDRRYTDAAGQVSFTAPDDPLRAAAYQRLRQISWRPELAQAGHTGGHFASGAPEFIAAYVAPLVARERWSSMDLASIKGARQSDASNVSVQGTLAAR